MTFLDRHVLVTGAGGSIGSEVCRRVVRENARRLVLVSLTESALYQVEKDLRRRFPHAGTEIVPVLGSFGDAGLIADALTGVDLVVHAGAHKHVPLCELNPLAAIANNVIGTHRLLRKARAAGVSQVCLISTDKAVRPSSVMGATKRVVERLAHDWSDHRTAVFVVRFGNVLDSAGSVLPLWREQIAAGGPLTLTDPRCERYFMRIEDAARLIADCASMRPAGGTFVLDMGKPLRLIDMAQELIAASGKDIAINCIGLRSGEKLTEELHFGGEVQPTACKGVNRVIEHSLPPIDPATFAALVQAVRIRDKEWATGLLWNLAA